MVALPFYFTDDLLYGGGLVEFVACIKEYQIVACGLLYAFVHGIIKSVVGLADNADEVGIFPISFHIALHMGKGVVCGASIDDDVLDVGVGLTFHTL